MAALLCLLAFAIRVYRLDYQSFHYDEYFSVSLAGQGFGELIARLTTNEPHPPLYYSLLHFWTGFAGDGEFAAKFLSLFFGVMVIPIGYRCAREVGGSTAGLVAGLLLAVNPFQLYHAQETRMYSTFEALALASSFFFLVLLRQQRRPLWAAYAATTTLAAAAHYEMLLLVAAQVGFVAVRATLVRSDQFWRELRGWSASWAAIAVAYLPWLVAARGIAFDYKSAETRPFLWPDSALRALHLAHETFASLNFLVVDVPNLQIQVIAIGALSVGALVATILWPLVKESRGGLCYLVVWALLPMGLALAMELRRPVFAVRYMIFLSPVLAILVALGAAQLARLSRWAAGALALAVALTYGQATFALYADPAYARADLRGLFGYLSAVARDGDALLLDCAYQDWAAKYYLRDPLPAFGFPLPESEQPKQDELLDGLSARYDRLWLVLGGYEECDGNRTVERALATAAFKGAEHTFRGGLQLVAYAGAKSAQSLADSNAPVDFGDLLRLTKWSFPSDAIEAGEIVPVRLVWQPKAKLDRDYAMSLRLINGADQVIVQRDAMPRDGYLLTSAWPAGEQVADNRGLALPVGLPRGDYRLELRAYDRADGRELPAKSDSGNLASGLVLGQITALPSARPPQPDAVSPMARLDRQAGSLWAVGYRREGLREAQPGQKVRFTLYWRSAQPSSSLAPGFRIALEAPDGRQVQLREFKAIEDLYPVSTWQPGGLTRLDYDFIPSPTVPSGRYRLRARWLAGGSPQELFGEEVTIRNERPLPRASQSEIANPRQVGLQQGVRFLGYDLDLEGQTTKDTLRVTLYWSAERPLTHDYAVFVHALDAAGKIVAQQDSPPALGAYPTSLWSPGDVIRDEHALKITSQRVDRLVFGLYLPATGKRLCVLAGDGTCDGDSITIEGL